MQSLPRPTKEKVSAMSAVLEGQYDKGGVFVDRKHMLWLCT
jgi:hypothetical protein